MTQTKNPHSDGPVSDAPAQRRPGPVVTAVGILMALWCLGFAAVNVTFEITGHFAGGTYGHYASGISVVDWLAAGLKVLGAVVALLSVAQRPRLASSDIVTVLVWAAFATLGVYTLGAAVEAAGMSLGLIGGASQIDTRSVAYVLFSWWPQPATASWPPPTASDTPNAKVSSSSVCSARRWCSACFC